MEIGEDAPKAVEMPYNLLDETGKRDFKGYVLSPKDTCTLEDIPQIIRSNTSSLKIEGRMKRPEYVAGVVSIYRRAIECFYENKEYDCKDDTKKLMQLFNREGFSKAYMYGNVGKDMMAISFPKNTGLILGEANKDLSFTLNENIKLKDGVRVGEGGFAVLKIIKNSLEVIGAKAGDSVKLIPTDYKWKDKLYKTSDVELLDNLSKSYSNIYERKINISIGCYFKVGELFELSCDYHGKVFKVQGELVQKAINRPVEINKVKENLLKTGNTPFNIESIDFCAFEDGFLPVSAINNTRRELINNILDSIYEKSKRVTDKKLDFNRVEKQGTSMEKLLVSVYNLEQLKVSKEFNVKAIMINFFNKKCDIKIQDVDDMKLYLKIPNIIKGEFDFICDFIEKNLMNIEGIVTANAGIISIFREKTKVIGDYKLNIFNKYSLDFYSTSLNGTYLSVELNRREIGEVAKNSPIPCGIVIYGKLEAMVSEYCPVGSIFGGKSTNITCNNECTKGEYKLKDRMGEEFLVRTDNYCRSHIYNSIPINLIDNMKDINSLGNIALRIDFVDENGKEVKEILTSYKTGEPVKDKRFTRGHYKRGVE